MAYRDDHEAALRRAEAAEREQARLADRNVELERKLDAAQQWLGTPRRRMLALFGVVVLCAGTAVGGAAIGRALGTANTTCPTCPPIPVAAKLPAVVGVIVADGPTVGHWTLTATKCVRRSDGVELTAVGSENYAVWMSSHSVEVEVPAGDFALDETKYCRGHGLNFGLSEKDGGYEGHVTLDCRWNDNKRPRQDDNRLQGRIDFTRCR